MFMPGTKKSTHPDLSVIVTAHNEGLLAHKTLRSVMRACQLVEQRGLRYEVIVSGDKLDDTTRDYLARSPFKFKLVEPDVGDLALSRNSALQHAKGTYISLIDADDLMSENWLAESLDRLMSLKDPTAAIAQSEHTLVFEGELALVKKYASRTTAEDSLLSVYGNRWTSVIVCHRKILKRFPYQPNTAGYGYEDWLFNCLTVDAGINHQLIPQTAIFVRRKRVGSLLQGQVHKKALLRSNPLLSFKHVRHLELPSHWQTLDDTNFSHDHILASRTGITQAKALLDRYPKARLVARKAYRTAKRLRDAARNQTQTTPPYPEAPVDFKSLPDWLVAEWRSLQAIDKELFPSRSALSKLTYYDSISPSHIKVGTAYKRLIDECPYDSYDYIIFAPWLIRGGGDLVTIRYANTIRQLHPDWKILVVGTENHTSPLQSELHGVTFVNFGATTSQLDKFEKERVMEQFIENSGCKRLHIINSLFAYDWCISHSTYLKSNAYKIVVTSFSQSRDPDGYVYGYSHTHAPLMYGMATLYTTDNELVRQMWIDEYGFDPAIVAVHPQPVDLPKQAWQSKAKSNYRILWASRLSAEKQPQLVGQIAKLLEDMPVTIDMYGEGDAGFDQTSFTASLPSNVRYARPFKGFADLPYQDYDLFLYTSLFDGMPNIILEAGAAGMPIVTAAVGGVPSLLSEGKDGLLVDTLDNPASYAGQIRKILANDDLRLQLAANVRQTVGAKHSWSQYQAVVKQLLSKLG